MHVLSETKVLKKVKTELDHDATGKVPQVTADPIT